MPYRVSARTRKPFRRTSRTARTRKPIRRKFFRRSKRTKRTSKSKAPFGMTKFATLRYSTYTVLTSTDTWQTQTYRLNSLYDPDFTGAGAQPRFYDTLCGANDTAAPYNSYRVHGARVKVNFLNANSSGNSTGIVAIRARNASSTALSPSVPSGIVQAVGEVPYTSWRWITSSGSDGCRRTFSKYFPIKPFYSVKDIRDHVELSAAYNTSPENIVLLDCHASTVNASSTPYNYQLTVSITYYCEFFNRNQPETS